MSRWGKVKTQVEEDKSSDEEGLAPPDDPVSDRSDVSGKWRSKSSAVGQERVYKKKHKDVTQYTKTELMNQKFIETVRKVGKQARIVKAQKEEATKGTEEKIKSGINFAVDESSSESEQSDEEENVDYRTFLATNEIPQEFWAVQKLIRYLRIGNQTATVIALCNMVDFDLEKEHIQAAIMDAGGLEVLTNLLETDEKKCKMGALKILRKITIHSGVRQQITVMGGIELTINLLSDPDAQLRRMATETLANLAKYKKARRLVRKYGGISKLVDLLDVDNPKHSSTDAAAIEMIEENEQISYLPLHVQVAKGSAFALWSLSKSDKNKKRIYEVGGLPKLARLVRMKHTSVLIPTIGTLQECAANREYSLAMQSDVLIQYLVRNLSTNSPELKMLCARAIFRLAEEEETKHLVKVHGGLEPLVEIIGQHKENKALMAAVTGAIWKVSSDVENVDRLEDLGIMQILVKLLAENTSSMDDLQFNAIQVDVLTNVVGCLSEVLKIQRNRDIICNEEGLLPLVKLLSSNHQHLLENACAALGECAKDKDALKVIQRLDGVRLLWSLLKNPSSEVQAAAAWAISPCIQNSEDSGDMVRSFVGGLELICSLLEAEDTEVLAAVCFAIANIADDKENLAVISDHGITEQLSRLAVHDDDQLRAKLALAIGNCCEWGSNRASFGKHGAVAPLVGYLASEDVRVHQTTTLALFQLSKDPWNCVAMHQNGVVGHLLRLIGSDDETVQEAAADCLQNIRKLALACEKFRYQHVRS